MDNHPTKLSTLLFSFLVFSQLLHLTLSYSSDDDDYYPTYVSVHPDDEKVLVQIQKQLGNNNAQPWMTDDYYDIECCVLCDSMSEPLVCDYDHRVLRLTLTYDYPTGSRPVIPTAVGKLVNLIDLTLSGRYFTSPIPGRALRKLTNLTSLSIRNTSIRGPIPGSLFGMENIRSLQLTNNRFITGRIPKGLAKLTGLQELDLSYNRLSGPIPGFLCHMTKLLVINLSFNRFSGSIPAFENLAHLDLSHNQLNGSIPNTFGSIYGSFMLNDNRLTGSIPRAMVQAATTTEIDVSNNKLTDASALLLSRIYFPYTDKINLSNNRIKFNFSNADFSYSLNSLNISHNMIYGSLLKPLDQLIGSLSNIDVSYNQLCGPIPTSSVLERFDATNFAHNKCLCGAPLPPCK